MPTGAVNNKMFVAVEGISTPSFDWKTNRCQLVVRVKFLWPLPFPRWTLRLAVPVATFAQNITTSRFREGVAPMSVRIPSPGDAAVISAHAVPLAKSLVMRVTDAAPCAVQPVKFVSKPLLAIRGAPEPPRCHQAGNRPVENHVSRSAVLSEPIPGEKITCSPAGEFSPTTKKLVVKAESKNGGGLLLTT